MDPAEQGSIAEQGITSEQGATAEGTTAEQSTTPEQGTTAEEGITAEQGADAEQGMSARSTAAKRGKKNELLCVAFSRDAKRFAIGGNDGFGVYEMEDAVEPVKITGCYRMYFPDDELYIRDVTLIECLPPREKLVLVMKAHPRLLLFYDAVSNVITGRNYFSDKILSIKSWRRVLAVGSEIDIEIFFLARGNYANTYKIERTVRLESGFNLPSIIDMSGIGIPVLALPYSADKGSVVVYEILRGRHPRRIIDAHNHPIGALCLNEEATLLATTSSIGTIVRIHSIASGECLCTFRRGLARSVTASSMAFGENAWYLSLSSNTETVHVFRVVLPKSFFFPHKKEKEQPKSNVASSSSSVETGPGWYDSLAEAARSATTPLPRDFVSAILPVAAQKSVATFRMIHGVLYVLVATTASYYYAYRINEVAGETELRCSQEVSVKGVTQASSSSQ